jgi:hypothetical protein
MVRWCYQKTGKGKPCERPLKMKAVGTGSSIDVFQRKVSGVESTFSCGFIGARSLAYDSAVSDQKDMGSSSISVVVLGAEIKQ